MARYQVGDDIGGMDIIGALDILSGIGKDARLSRLQGRAAKRGNDGDGLLGRRINRLIGKVNGDEMVVNQTPEVLRNFPMPLGRVSLAAGASDYLQQNAQRTIRIQRLVLSSADLSDIDVTSINLGVEQQNASIANQPAEAYDFRAVGTTFRGTTLNPGMTASVGLINNASSGTASIGGVFYGEALQF